MKLLFQLLLILVVFLKTGNLLSDSNIFNVNNILVEKKENTSNEELANKAISKAYKQLIEKILLKEDIKNLNNLNYTNIKGLVSYYNIVKNAESVEDKITFSVTFDRDKIHSLLYNKDIPYSDITDKDFYILPIFISKNEIFVFSKNYFYENWNLENNEQLVEFILPTENIEIIYYINQLKNNLIALNLNSLFKEYSNKNVAIVLIENINTSNEQQIYLKARIQNKIISKRLNFKKNSSTESNLSQKIIATTKDEIIDLIKSQNLIDLRTPSFLNVKLNSNNANSLFLLNSKIKDIGLIEEIYIQEINKETVNLKIKYLGNLEKIINQLKNKNINLNQINDQWFIKIS